MGFFFGGPKVEAILFSPMEGKITLNGIPAAGAKLRLYIAWNDTKGETFEYLTDDSGYFKIPRHSAVYRQTILAQLVISQEITVEFQGAKYEVWLFSKKEPEEFTELGFKPSNLICELMGGEQVIRGKGSLGGTRFTWDIQD